MAADDNPIAARLRPSDPEAADEIARLVGKVNEMNDALNWRDRHIELLNDALFTHDPDGPSDIDEQLNEEMRRSEDA